MGGVGFSRQHGATVDRFVAITFERSNANDFFFVPEGCYQVFLLKKIFFKLDLVYIHTYISGADPGFKKRGGVQYI